MTKFSGRPKRRLATVPSTLTADGLRAWRERHNLSQTGAAEALQCSRRAYIEWEAGRRRPPGYIALACAAISAGVPPMR